MTSSLLTPAVLERVRDRLARTVIGAPTPTVVAAALRAEIGAVLGDTDVLAALRVLHTEFSGAGPLEPLLTDPLVTDILVVGPHGVWVDRGTGLIRITSVVFPDDAAVRRLAQRLALLAGRRLDDAQPWVDGRLPDGVGAQYGLRLHAVLAPVAHGGTCLSLRVLRPATQGLDALTGTGAMSDAAAALLRRIVAARLTFLVTGATGAGKTTLLAALLGEVDPAERIVCVQDAAELAPQHPHVVHLIARPPNVEGVGEVTIRDLVRQVLRMRPDRIVVGEVRGAEVVDLLAALNTGHDGGAGTVHANSPAELPARLEALAALGGLGRAALHSQLGAAVHVIVHVHRHVSGLRAVREIGVLRRGEPRESLRGEPRESPCGAGQRVEVVTAWHADSAMPTPGAGALRQLLGERS